MAEVSFLFEYPQLGRDMVSQSPPVPRPGVRGPTCGRDPELCPYDSDSGSDSEDYESDTALEDEEDEEQPELDWHPHAINFLAPVPQSDAAWSVYLTNNLEVRSLCYRLRIPLLYPGYFVKDYRDWEKFFGECTWHLARACQNPALASILSLIFIAACHVALADGCPRWLVLHGLRACVRQCGIWEDELTGPMLDRLREGAVKGISILADYARAVGSRAHEAPLHTCTTSVKGRTPTTYRPSALLDSGCLEIPVRVYSLLGGPDCKWEYQDIFQILRPDGVLPPLHRDIGMNHVLEYDEESDDEDFNVDGPGYPYKGVFGFSFPGVFPAKEFEGF